MLVGVDIAGPLPAVGPFIRAHNGAMRLIALTLVGVLSLGAAVPAVAQRRATLGERRASPSPSASARDRGAERGRPPGFVALLLLLGAGLVWQLQRARRTTAEVSRRSLDHLERTMRPDEERRDPGV